MSDIINNNDVDVLSEYFEVVSGDVYVTFKGVICCSLSGGVKNVLYGKTINMSEMYDTMMDDITKMIIDCDFSKDEYLNKRGHQNLIDSVSKYTIKKYGVSFKWVDKIVNGRIGSYDCDRIYECMIDRVGGIEKIDWLKVYESTKSFITHNHDILMCIANEILKNDIYRYFVNRYNLKATGIKNVGRKTHTTQTEKFIILEWDSGNRRSVPLADLVINKKEWWRQATLDPRTRRGDIQDYDVLLNGRDENEVLPDVCPIDNNIVLNYTKIDFSVNTNHNVNECKNHNDTTDYGDKTWSFASIDRIDSTKPYSYDNIEVISTYYNTQVKNCASHSQIGKLYYYQLKKLLSKKISKELVKSMSDDELYKVSDMFSVYFKLFEIVSDNSTILHKEMVRRDKKSKLVVKV
jgi:predicted house-cleaning noncanonical NTP pyrophosphatase (MazG superfamily)